LEVAIDVDAAVTWPLKVRRNAEAIANVVRGQGRYVTDLSAPPGAADEFRRFFVGSLLRAYHATRLLDHEVAMIRGRGLRTLTEDLLVERIERAHEFGYVSPEDRDSLLAGHVFAAGRFYGRVGHVSLFVSKSPLDKQVHAVRPPLTTWGGEGIYMGHGAYSLRETLRGMGTPTIVVVDVDLGPDPQVHGIYPDLWKLFVARLLGHEPLSSDLLYKTSVPPGGVVDFWGPGHPEYDAHKRLPRS
jgi:hypothetical protein